MKNPDTLQTNHDHPFELNTRGRIAVGAAAIFLAGGLVAAFGHNTKAETPVNPELTASQLFDAQIAQAINDGPKNQEEVIGTFPVQQDYTIANAMIREATRAGYEFTPENEKQDNLTITLSSSIFDKQQPGIAYQPSSKFVLYETDVNGDGTKELLAKAVEADK